MKKKQGSAACTHDTYTESKNIAFMATMITNGTGRGIVTHTGAQTMIGRIAVLTSGAKQETTTLQREINNFVLFIAVLAITTVTVCFVVWAAWIYQSYPRFITVSAMLVNAIAILVAFIPTGLPVAVTLSLLLVARKMARHHVLVKNLTIIETLSCCNVIASDKTGTLTQNKMYVVNATAGLTIITATRARRASVMGVQRAELNASLQLLNACILCNEAKFEDSVAAAADVFKSAEERVTTGGATDVAILRYGANYREVAEVEADYEVLDKQVGIVPFNSKNKWMARVFKVNQNRGQRSQEEEEDRVADCYSLGGDECVITMKGKLSHDSLGFSFWLSVSTLELYRRHDCLFHILNL